MEAAGANAFTVLRNPATYLYPTLFGVAVTGDEKPPTLPDEKDIIQLSDLVKHEALSYLIDALLRTKSFELPLGHTEVLTRE